MPENIAGSLKQVKSSAVFPLEILMEEFKNEIPYVRVVYDEQLEYESVITKLRNDEAFTTQGLSQIPVVAYNRSVLRHAQDAGPGRRAGRILSKGPKQGDPNSQLIYRWVHGEFDLNFRFFTTNMDQLENFEISYLGEEGISGIRNLDVNIPDIGDFTWFVHPRELTEKVIQIEQAYHKVVEGSLVVRGNYFILRNEAKKILTVNAKINNEGGTVTHSDLQVNA